MFNTKCPYCNCTSICKTIKQKQTDKKKVCQAISDHFVIIQLNYLVEWQLIKQFAEIKLLTNLMFRTQGVESFKKIGKFTRFPVRS